MEHGYYRIFGSITMVIYPKKKATRKGSD
jgi:hypothetical protein